MGLINLGNAVGLLRGTTPPAKSYVIWGKVNNPATPDIVELRYYKGTGDVALETNWLPFSIALSKVFKTIPIGTTEFPIPSSEWSILGKIPLMQLINTQDGSIEYATPKYNGMTAANNWTPTDAVLYFGTATTFVYLLAMA